MYARPIWTYLQKRKRKNVSSFIFKSKLAVEVAHGWVVDARDSQIKTLDRAYSPKQADIIS